jgi:glycosyltransferase involved in cell wall biosynthesis
VPTPAGMPAPPSRRVLLVSQPTVGGCAVHVRDLARHAAAAGWDVTVACPTDGSLAGWLADDPVRVVPVAMTRSPGPADVGAVRALRRLVAAADVVHLHSSKGAAVGRAALALLGPRHRRPGSAFTPHGWSWWVGGSLAPAYRLVERALAGLTDVTIAVSEEERRHGEAALGPRAARRLRVIGNGVDVDRFSPDGPVAPRRGAPLVVCVGRFDYAKGQDRAIAVLAALRSPGARLRLVGDGPARAALAAAAGRLGVADRLELAGTIDDVAPHLRAADVVILPSRWEALSIGMLEAMACGAPVVGFPVGGATQLDAAGRLVPDGDVAAMAAAVDALLADPAARRELGTAARQLVLDRFRADRRRDDVLEVWEELAR